MKRLMAIILLAVFALTSCGGVGPDKTVDAFFTAAKTLDTETMASLILPSKVEDIEVIKTFLDEEDNDPFSEQFQEYFVKAAKEITYKILETKVDGDNAKVKVEAQYVDSKNLLNDVFNEIFKRAFETSLNEEEVDEEDVFANIVSDLTPETLVAETTKVLDMKLVKFEDKWYFEEMTEETLDVLSAGFLTAADNLDFFDDFDELDEDE